MGIAYSYNGVMLPKLPEWDREKYPYAWMVMLRRAINDYAHKAALFLTTIPLYSHVMRYSANYYSVVGKAKADGECVVYTCGSDDSSVDAANSEFALAPDDDFFGTFVAGEISTWMGTWNTWLDAVIWANYDLYDYDDGTLYLPASEPVPVTVPKWAHMNSFLAGLALGLAGKPLKLAQKEPVAWLYNGVRLPDIYKVYTPELQKTHPYAVILGDSSGSFWLYPTRLILSTVPLRYVDNNVAYWNLMYGSASGSCIGYEWANYDGENQIITYDPGFVRKAELDITFAANGGAVSNSLKNDILWANYDVYNHPSATTLVMGACNDPVPVFE